VNIEMVVLHRVGEAESEDLEREASLPYVMVCEDLTSQHLTFAGPYSSKEEAAAAVAYEGASSTDDTMRFFCAPIFPPFRPEA
jgi:hypothetical protein